MFKKLVVGGAVLVSVGAGIAFGYSRGFEDGAAHGKQAGRVETLIDEGYSLREVAQRIPSPQEKVEPNK